MQGEICAYGTQTVAIDAHQPAMTHKFTPDGGALIPIQPKDQGGERLTPSEVKGKL